MRAPSIQRGGLTLVEILLAMAILSIGAAVLTTAVSRCLAVVRVSKNYYNARHVMDLGELEHPVLFKKENNQDVVVNLRVGPIDYENGYTFRREAERSETLEDLCVVRTRVTWSARGKDAFEEVVSYLYYTNEIP
jgi:prepilin-type N-terminal cleavage/methylation domain-containing protein